jgi:hypothetical protein
MGPGIGEVGSARSRNDNTINYSIFTDAVEWNILQIERSHVIMPSFRYVDDLTPKDLSLKHMKLETSIGRYPYYLLGLYFLRRSQPRSNPLCLFSYIPSTIRINL